MAIKQKKFRRVVTKSEVKWKLLGIVALIFVCVVLVFPNYLNRGVNWVNAKTNVGLPNIAEKGFNLGLDLQGGAHLIYKANTENIPEADRANSVEGVRDVIERRVRGGLGVAEPLVQTTKVGDENRIIVELPGVTDVNTAIKMIGETPVLEFKEVNNDPPRELTAAEKKQLADFNAAAEKKAKEALAATKSGMEFNQVVAKYSEDDLSKNINGDLGFITEDYYPEIYSWVKTHKDGDITTQPIKSYDGLSVVKRIAERPGSKEITAQHILICYQGATECNPQYTYTKDQALSKVNEIKAEATAKNFTDLAKKYSTEPGSPVKGGELPPFTKGQMVAEFENAAWDAADGSIVGPVETQFGYHVIYKKSERVLPEYDVARIFIKTKSEIDIVPPAEQWKSSGLSGKQLKRAEVTEDTRTGQIQVSLQFNDEGTKLFADLTTRNAGQPVAIFLDGEPISTPRVNEPILSGNAVISGGFTLTEARLLAQRLNSGALPVPVELISQKTVGASLGADSLNKSFTAGLYALLAVMLFMIAYYRLPGLLAVFSLLFYGVLTLALFKLLGVTLTLSGVAGFILSIGMAVDANILVFERLKEEMRSGRLFKSAVEESFVRSWPSIRDSHITALISCVFLIWFGSGFIQGFAVVLFMGTLINLFTAITVTRTILRIVTYFLPESGNRLVLGYTSQIFPTQEKTTTS